MAMAIIIVGCNSNRIAYLLQPNIERRPEISNSHFVVQMFNSVHLDKQLFLCNVILELTVRLN